MIETRQNNPVENILSTLKRAQVNFKVIYKTRKVDNFKFLTQNQKYFGF